LNEGSWRGSGAANAEFLEETVGSETKTRKYRATHQIVTMLLVFLMGVALGWVLRGGPGAKLDEGPPLEVVQTSPETDVSEPTVEKIPNPTETLEPAEPLASEEGPAPADSEEEAGALEMIEDVWPARHLIIAVSGTTLSDETKSFLSEIKPGGIVLSKNNIENRNQTATFVAGIKEAVGLGTEVYDLPLIAVDQEGGVVNPLNLESAPGAPELGAKRDLDGAREVGTHVGQSCRERGIGIVLAPVLDVVLPGAPEVIKARRTLSRLWSGRKERGSACRGDRTRGERGFGEGFVSVCSRCGCGYPGNDGWAYRGAPP